MSQQQALDQKLKEIFGDDTPFPQLTNASLYAFVDGDTCYPFGDICLVGADDLEAWAGDATPEIQQQLTLILAGPDGFHYGIWRYDNQPIDQAPVVYLDDEGCGNSVVANNWEEFLPLIQAIGLSGRLSPDSTTYWQDAPDEREKPLTDKLFAHFNIIPATSLAKSVQQASENHPDFDAWLENFF